MGVCESVCLRMSVQVSEVCVGVGVLVCVCAHVCDCLSGVHLLDSKIRS